MINNKRIDWIDCLKFIGIFAIYLGHFGENAGLFYKFSFGYSVPLFFFIAGFFSLNKKEVPFLEYLKNIFIKLMIPYFVFSILYLIILQVYEGFGISKTFDYLIKILFGIRNITPSGNLWFLNCLFVMNILNIILIKVLKKKKWLLLFIAILLNLIVNLIFPKFNLIVPCMFWNIDSALYYYIYFVVGMFAIDIIKKLNENGTNNKVIRILLFITTFLFAAVYYFKGNTYIIQNILKLKNNFLILIYNFVKTMILIIFNIYLAFFIRKQNIFAKIGSKTLYLCGMEFTIKLLVWQFLISIGLSVRYANPLNTILYNLLTIFVAYFLINFFRLGERNFSRGEKEK